MRLTVIGTGYVGLVAGVCFAEVGNDVICVDLDQDKIKLLKSGGIPIYEPGLKETLERVVRLGRLHFTTETGPAVAQSDVVILAVGTPPDEDGSADLKHVLAAARAVAASMQGYTVVVDKSTVPVGTADKVRAAMREVAGESAHFDVVSNPEFLKEGAALNDFLKPDRVVMGADSDRARDLMLELYEPFVRTGHPIVTMDVRSAELTKYAANAMLATKISFMNEIARICDLAGANVEKVRLGIGSDSRIGPQFLFPGVGYGGSCFPKDVKAVIKTAASYDYEFHILKAVERVNAAQKQLMVTQVKARFGEDLSGMTFAMWGLAFKPRTDDMREAPALEIIDGLMACGAQFVVYDPEAMDECERRIGKKVTYAKEQYAALQDVDALLVATEWSDFREPDFERMHKSMKNPIVFDGRNVYNPAKIRSKGFEYTSIGRP
jgi:UDPglucose 6-dehydrogenase